MIVLEVGFKLENSFRYYNELLKKNGLKNVFNCKTHDIYYTKYNLDGLTENEMKRKCIRLRNVNNEEEYKIQNSNLIDIKEEKISKKNLKSFEEKLFECGYKKIFDTLKKDHHYYKDGMHSRVQLQEIKNVGLLVYYDNEDYYKLPFDKQRKKLIDDLNNYGFNFDYEKLGLDKLRTLYYGKAMYSKNQNG